MVHTQQHGQAIRLIDILLYRHRWEVQLPTVIKKYGSPYSMQSLGVIQIPFDTLEYRDEVGGDSLETNSDSL